VRRPYVGRSGRWRPFASAWLGAIILQSAFPRKSADTTTTTAAAAASIHFGGGGGGGGAEDQSGQAPSLKGSVFHAGAGVPDPRRPVLGLLAHEQVRRGVGEGRLEGVDRWAWRRHARLVRRRRLEVWGRVRQNVRLRQTDRTVGGYTQGLALRNARLSLVPPFFASESVLHSFYSFWRLLRMFFLWCARLGWEEEKHQPKRSEAFSNLVPASRPDPDPALRNQTSLVERFAYFLLKRLSEDQLCGIFMLDAKKHGPPNVCCCFAGITRPNVVERLRRVTDTRSPTNAALWARSCELMSRQICLGRCQSDSRVRGYLSVPQ